MTIKIPVYMEQEPSSSTDQNGSKKSVLEHTASLRAEENFTPTPPQAITKHPSRTSPSHNEDVRSTTAARDGLVCMNNNLTFKSECFSRFFQR